MRILASIGLLWYSATHPGQVQHLLHVAVVTATALAHHSAPHAAGAALAQGAILALSSHWN